MKKYKTDYKITRKNKCKKCYGYGYTEKLIKVYPEGIVNAQKDFLLEPHYFFENEKIVCDCIGVK